MTNTSFIVSEKSGVNQISLTLPLKAEAKRFGIIDGALALGLMAVVAGLIFWLSK